MYVDDVVEALLAATAPEAIGRVFNVGNVIDHSLAEIASAIIDATGSNGGLRLVPWPQDHQRIDIGSFHTDGTTIAEVLGWKATTSLDIGLRDDRDLLSWSPVVPVVDLSRRGQRFASTFAKAAERIAASGSFLLGAELSAFESEFAEWLGAPHCVAVSSGAGALQLALAAAGIGAGDEVLVPAFTAVPTASAVAAIGAIPRAIDVDPQHGLHHHREPSRRGVHRAPRRSSSSTSTAIPAELPATDLLVIEDAAQAHGALHDPGRSVATAYSFYPTKNLGGIGDGGAVVTNDADLAERVRRLRVHGMTAAVRARGRLAELPDVGGRGGLVAPRARGARPPMSRDAARSSAGIAQAAPRPALAGRRPAPRLPSRRVSQRRPRRHARRTGDAAESATAVHYPLAITQQPAYRDLGACVVPGGRGLGGRVHQRAMLSGDDRGRGRSCVRGLGRV